jgi:hypothetical protein
MSIAVAERYSTDATVPSRLESVAKTAAALFIAGAAFLMLALVGIAVTPEAVALQIFAQ